MTKLAIGTGMAVLDVVSLGCLSADVSVAVISVALFASILDILPWADQLAARLMRGNES